MARAAAILLLVLTTAALLINVYFVTLIYGRGAAVQRRLSGLFHACGADTSTCALVVTTPYARIFAGAPNVLAGIFWCVALYALAGYWLASGRLVVPWPYLMVAAGTVSVAGYLIYALVVILRQPCPL
jgi:uncharacterized membrane protein